MLSCSKILSITQLCMPKVQNYAHIFPYLGNWRHRILKIQNHNETRQVYQKRPLQERKIEEIGKEKRLLDLEIVVKKEQFKKGWMLERIC